MTSHLSDRTLVDLVDDSLVFAERVEALIHLAACDNCRNRFRELQPELAPAHFRRWFGTAEPPPAQASTSLDEDVRSVLGEVMDAERLWDEVSLMEPSQRRLLVLNSSRFRTLGFPMMIAEIASQVWRHTPHQALDLTDLAVELLGKLTSTNVKHTQQVRDASAQALTYRANCHRILGRYEQASQDLAQAHEYLGQHSEVPFTKLLEHQSSLQRSCRDLPAARRSIRSAIRIYQQVGDHQSVIRLTLKDCLTLRDADEPELALAQLREIPKSYKLTEIGMGNLLGIHHNSALLLADLGETSKALIELNKTEVLGREIGRLRFDTIRRKWVEALIFDRAGQLEEAEGSYLAVQQFFLDERIGHEVAGVSLELALLYLRWGRYEKARQLVREITPIFLSHQLQPEAMASQLVSWQALLRQIQLTPTR